MKRAIQIYFVLGLLFIALYAVGEIVGYEPVGVAVERIDPSVCQSLGGSGGGGGGTSFWHTGFHGGK